MQALRSSTALYTVGLKPKLLLGGKEWQLATRAGYRDKETSP